MCEFYRAVGIFGGANPVLNVVGRVERLSPAWVHPMHGGSMPADTLQGYMTALRTQPFTFDGRLFGGIFPTGHSVDPMAERHALLRGISQLLADAFEEVFLSSWWSITECWVSIPPLLLIGVMNCDQAACCLFSPRLSRRE
jgi:hypothetical protein